MYRLNYTACNDFHIFFYKIQRVRFNRRLIECSVFLFLFLLQPSLPEHIKWLSVYNQLCQSLLIHYVDIYIFYCYFLSSVLIQMQNISSSALNILIALKFLRRRPLTRFKKCTHSCTVFYQVNSVLPSRKQCLLGLKRICKIYVYIL